MVIFFVPLFKNKKAFADGGKTSSMFILHWTSLIKLNIQRNQLHLRVIGSCYGNGLRSSTALCSLDKQCGTVFSYYSPTVHAVIVKRRVRTYVLTFLGKEENLCNNINVKMVGFFVVVYFWYSITLKYTNN